MPKIKAVITDYIGTLANARNHSMEALKIKLHKILMETGFETSMEEFPHRVHQSSRKYRVVRCRKLTARVTIYDATYFFSPTEQKQPHNGRQKTIRKGKATSQKYTR